MARPKSTLVEKVPSSPDEHEHVRVAIALGLLALATQINFYDVKFFGDDSVFLAFLFVLVALAFGLYLTLIAFRFAPGEGLLADYVRSLGGYAHGAYVGTAAFSYLLLAFTFSSFLESLLRQTLAENQLSFASPWIIVLLTVALVFIPLWNIAKKKGLLTRKK